MEGAVTGKVEGKCHRHQREQVVLLRLVVDDLRLELTLDLCGLATDGAVADGDGRGLGKGICRSVDNVGTHKHLGYVF